jgi:ectoine hydroxylase-related dioxygenase (phytanoyl-CoA dioxygenase family)
MMDSTAIADVAQRAAEAIRQDGFYRLGPLLDADEVAALRTAMDRKRNDPEIAADPDGDHIRGVSLMRMFEYDRAFRDLIVREPIVSIAEAVLGDDCHLMAQNALLTEPGTHLDWHVDDRVFFPLPEQIEQHDPRIGVPCFVLNVLIPLTDVDELQYGPTQVVPGSHLAGRRPDTRDEPTFAGRGPESLFARAGDAYMFHNQVWHRGAPNASERTRYVASAVYSQRIIAQRFYPFIDYQLPAHVLADADARLQRLMGRHAKGAYG